MVGSKEQEGSARMIDLYEAKSAVDMARHLLESVRSPSYDKIIAQELAREITNSVSVTTLAVPPRVPIASAYSSYSNTSTKR